MPRRSHVARLSPSAASAAFATAAHASGGRLSGSFCDAATCMGAQQRLKLAAVAGRGRVIVIGVGAVYDLGHGQLRRQCGSNVRNALSPKTVAARSD